MNKLDKTILTILEDQKEKPIPRKILIDKVLLTNKEIIVKNIFHSFRYLEKIKKIKILPNGKVVLSFNIGNEIPDTKAEGTISINSYGDGFIKPTNDPQNEVYINIDYTNGALNEDLVEFVKTDGPSKKNLAIGKVLKVIKRAKDIFVGEFKKTATGYEVILNDFKINKKIIIENLSGIVDGHKLLMKAIEYHPDSINVEVIKIIGHKNDVGIDILSIVYDYNIEPEFPQAVIDAANLCDKTVTLDERQKRKDLTNLPFITIDPETSKDLDDAICVKKENENYRLWVSIADVSHFITMNSVLDQEAFNRGTSIYLVNKVIPMIPHLLSNDICSLNPNEERLTLTCEMLINPNGEFKSIDVYPSVFINKRRFAYNEVNQYYAKENLLVDDTDEIRDVLDISYELFKILRRNFKKRGYIDFEINEPKIVLDENEKPIDIVMYERGDAQMMIENFMVAANEAVTINFQKNHLPFIYRVHDKPNETKLKNFAIEAKKLNFKIDNNINDIKPNTIAKWIDDNRETSSSQLINKLLLRVMAKAEYSTNNIAHFGLASKFYTHFTSPIRRYPDLIVHRLYRMFTFEKHLYSNEQRSFLLSKLNEICQQSSKKEEIAVAIEREVNALKFAEYMEKHVGDIFEGIISHITGFGIFIELKNSVEGLCKISNIKINDFFNYIVENNTFVGNKTKIVLSFGTLVKVRVVSVNLLTKKIDLELIELIK
ncbi:MAG: ribonuclease R [Mycoplasmoidaceae bacterium]